METLMKTLTYHNYGRYFQLKVVSVAAIHSIYHTLVIK